MNGHNIFSQKYLWKLKSPLKIKILMFFLNIKYLIRKDNLDKREWFWCKFSSFVIQRKI
jgi:hypothetical protein